MLSTSFTPNNFPLKVVDLKERVDRESHLSSCPHREILFFLDLVSKLNVTHDFHEPLRNLGIQDFKTHQVVTEDCSDMFNILHQCCLFDLCQPFGGLSK